MDIPTRQNYIGQNTIASEYVMTLQKEQIQVIDDISDAKPSYRSRDSLSDIREPIGFVSDYLANQICQKLGFSEDTSVFTISLGGARGLIARC